MAYWIFWAEGTRDIADTGRALCPPPFYLKADHKINHEKGALSGPGKENSYHWGLRDDAKSAYSNKPLKMTLIFH